jgi:hypothetical protein
VGTVVALSRAVGIGVNIDGIIGTSLHAGFAANADFRVKLDNPVMPLVHRGDRADADTGRIGAVITAANLKVAFGLGELPFFHVFDPGAIDPQGYFIFRLTSRAASMAANTGLVIDHKTVVHIYLLEQKAHSWLSTSATLIFTLKKLSGPVIP